MTSPFVLPLHGVGVDVNRQPFFVCPVMVNGSMDDHLERRANDLGDRMDEYLYDIARGVMYLHEVACVIYTDLKPVNYVLVTLDGRGVVADFGFSALTGGKYSAVLPGTLFYLNPEKLGRKIGVEDALSMITTAGDAYAFGIMIWGPELPKLRPIPSNVDIPDFRVNNVATDMDAVFQQAQSARIDGHYTQALQLYKHAAELKHLEAQSESGVALD
ncbi:kinase-like protein [Gonapodya prolifera JEL478]|uniref:Kinase-like protein n=1 Tax=Gonapodya prolifera (strain JEL478) TaxID=1344416 RepID=A0A139AHC6_GONPJ|nr:kinase-like protein [Gonapodya prolifera JEL478]|eukprot:KXS15813.1 kinase-like protein [Gonapodya prolifera JEL478]